MDGSDTFYKLALDSTLPSDIAADLLTLSASWQRTDIADGASGNASVEGVDSGLGYSTYSLAFGSDSSPLEAGTYSVTLTGVGENDDITLDTFEIVVGNGAVTIERGVSWTIPAVGDDQVVIVDGVRVDAGRNGEFGDRLLVDAGLTEVGSVDYSAFYGTAFADVHSTTVTSTEQFNTDNSTTPPTVTSLGFDIDIATTLSTAESANITGDLHLAWRDAGSGTDFANDIVLTGAGDTYSTSLSQLPGGEYDLKLYYTDANGDEVIVDWLRADTAEPSSLTTGRSVTLEAGEVNGSIGLDANGLISVDPGLYSGPVGDILGDLALAGTATGNLGDSLAVDGSDTGYFTENRYNALDAQIATNAQTGLWREFGVDGNGNALVTENYGLDRSGTPITTFILFDGRNREVAHFAAETTQSDGTSARAVTRTEYDVLDNVTQQTDANGGETRRTWSALGMQLTETDQLANTTTYRYDRLGHRTAEIDALGNGRYSFYDTVGNLVQEVDGEGNSTTHAYDVFGRRIQVTNALGQR
ncbi:hypothetical protein KQ940_22460, partial [Marinobacterium sp. D7]|nr:hypothetical protein [Marinobacterium ramblicola]